jgi:hypothetical protein
LQNNAQKEKDKSNPMKSNDWNKLTPEEQKTVRDALVEERKSVLNSTKVVNSLWHEWLESVMGPAPIFGGTNNSTVKINSSNSNGLTLTTVPKLHANCEPSNAPQSGPSNARPRDCRVVENPLEGHQERGNDQSNQFHGTNLINPVKS